MVASKYDWEVYGGWSKGPCKGGTVGNTLPSKGDPNQRGDLHYGHFGDGYFEQLPYDVLFTKNDIQGIQDHDIGSYLGFYILLT